mmetsp:Transcript_83344/g.258830  ORF Transcript_83344/g.258830 Transcript_83344/m.258830 type:complete len:190 (-) Transcript_83344:2-571(-)
MSGTDKSPLLAPNQQYGSPPSIQQHQQQHQPQYHHQEASDVSLTCTTEEEPYEYDPEDFYSLRVNDIKVQYEAVFIDSRKTKTVATVEQCNRQIYVLMRDGMLFFLTLICGWALAFSWGIMIATVMFFNKFMFAPCAKVTFLLLGPTLGIYRVVVRLMVDPLFEAMGRVFSGIKVRLSAKENASIAINV